MIPKSPKEWYESLTQGYKVPWESCSETFHYMWTLAYEEQFTKTSPNTLSPDAETKGD
jgi:peptidoglycan/LPS O-acetylase OafA/YrhL